MVYSVIIQIGRFLGNSLFDSLKINNVRNKAGQENIYDITTEEIDILVQEIIKERNDNGKGYLSVEEIQDVAEKVVINNGYIKIGAAYVNCGSEHC